MLVLTTPKPSLVITCKVSLLIYEVSFNANISSATSGPVALGLYQDGVLIPGTTVIAQVTTSGDFFNVSFNKLIKSIYNLYLFSDCKSMKYLNYYKIIIFKLYFFNKVFSNFSLSGR